MGNAWIYGEISEGIYFLAIKSLRSNTILFIFLLFTKSIDFNVHSSYGFYLYFTKCNFNRIFNGNIHFIRQFSRLFVIFFLCVQSKELSSRQDQNAVKTIVFFSSTLRLYPFCEKVNQNENTDCVTTAYDLHAILWLLCYHSTWPTSVYWAEDEICMQCHLCANIGNCLNCLNWEILLILLRCNSTDLVYWIFFEQLSTFFTMIRCWSSKFYFVFVSKRFFFFQNKHSYDNNFQHLFNKFRSFTVANYLWKPF